METNLIYGSDEASVAYTPRNPYVPDFVVLEGTYWIIEGKSERERTDETVQLKQEAAEKAVCMIASTVNHGPISSLTSPILPRSVRSMNLFNAPR
ncbi:DNA restriction-modification system, restriction enzyme [Corynebacterium ulcerans]|nr:DNA restriction-modification system, restriction enzyme [Corynebacterium ulcerans]SQH02978.1 DNA restriction-modification system, restriction enzyme [Corynebacterium ulcerans]